jgi:uncharacterized protein (DUF1697 family)
MKHIALLRGINVGGNNKLPMKDLARFFTDAGCTDVHTFVQSGNVIFEPGKRELKKLAERIEHSISQEFGFRSPVLVRSAEELNRAVRANPLNEAEDALHLVFLADLPDPAAAQSLDPARSPGDRFIVQGREIYLHLPKGVAKTRLTNTWFDTKLRTTSTMRNWRTVLKLLELVSAQ